MKKILTCMLAVAMLLAFCVGCGNQPADVSTPVDNSVSDVSTTTTTTTADTTTTEDASTGDTTTEDVSVDTTTEDAADADTTTAKPSTTTAKPTATQTQPTTKPTTKPTTTTTTKTTSTTKTTATTTTTTTVTTTTTAAQPKAKLNDVNLSEYTIVYGANASDYVIRAAMQISLEIEKRVGIELEVYSDADIEVGEHEIVVGETNRTISKVLNASMGDLEFALMANGGHVAMEAKYFTIAAAAYYFIETYITGEDMDAAVPTKATVCQPIVEKPNNFIFLIGDGMGVNQTLLFESMSASSQTDYSDGERAFYGYSFPYAGFSRTDSLDGTTDSAAGGTALSTGSKTKNGRVGRDKDKNDLLSLTELAGSLGMATAVMSTESPIGATPASFSAHANKRDDNDQLYESQNILKQTYGTIINCQFDFYNAYGLEILEGSIQNTLDKVSKNEKGFFLMYEEAHIDKHSHNQDAAKTFRAVVRFNQAIGLFMEYAFYNPDTFVLITADHETGGLQKDGTTFKYSHGNHTSADVPVFVYGIGGELFDGKTIENVQIPKTIARFMGGSLMTSTDDVYPPLNP